MAATGFARSGGQLGCHAQVWCNPSCSNPLFSIGVSFRSEEVPAAAEIVAEAFFEPLPLGPFNNMLYFAFQVHRRSNASYQNWLAYPIECLCQIHAPPPSGCDIRLGPCRPRCYQCYGRS